MNRLLERLRWPVAVSAVLAAAVGVWMAYAAIQHNPQEAYCVHRAARDGCAIRLVQVVELVAAWFIPTFVVALLVSVAVGELLRLGARTTR